MAGAPIPPPGLGTFVKKGQHSYLSHCKWTFRGLCPSLASGASQAAPIWAALFQTNLQTGASVVGSPRNSQEIDHHPIHIRKRNLRSTDDCFKCFLVQRGCIKLSHARKCLFPTSTARLCLQVSLVIQSEQLQVLSCHPTWVSENFLH